MDNPLFIVFYIAFLFFATALFSIWFINDDRIKSRINGIFQLLAFILASFLGIYFIYEAIVSGKHIGMKYAVVWLAISLAGLISNIANINNTNNSVQSQSPPTE